MYLVWTLKILNAGYIQIGRDEAKTLLELLGMDDLLKLNEHWEKISAGINAVDIVSSEELIDDEFKDENEDQGEVPSYTADLELQEEQFHGINDDISTLQTNNGLSDEDAAYIIQWTKFSRLPANDIGIGLPVYVTQSHETNLNSKTSHNKNMYHL